MNPVEANAGSSAAAAAAWGGLPSGAVHSDPVAALAQLDVAEPRNRSNGNETDGCEAIRSPRPPGRSQDSGTICAPDR